MHLIQEDPIKNSTSSKKKSSLGAAIKNKIKGVKNYVHTAHTNYKNRTDDTNKYRSILYWNKNKN